MNKMLMFFNLYRSLMGDRRSPARTKVLPWVALLYAISPIDFVPDIIPLLGQLDDVGVVILLLWLAYQAVSKGLVNEHWNRLKRESIDVTSGTSRSYTKP